MKRRTLIAGIAAIAVVLAAGVGIVLHRKEPPPAPEALDAASLPPGFKAIVPPLPMGDTTFQDADGKTVALADFRGRPVLLNIWAKWCAPCVIELPQLDKLQTNVRPETLAVVAVAVDEPDPAKVRNFLLNRNMTALHPYLDPKNVFAKLLNIRSIPVSVLIDRNGYALARADAPVSWYSDEAVQFLQQTILRQPG